MRVLAVSHAASRDGAPLSLLAFLRWAAEQGQEVPEVLLLEGGPLADDLGAVSPQLWEGLDAPGLDLDAYDTVLLNSAFAAPVLAHPIRGRVVARVPELGVAVDRLLPAEERAALLTRPDAYVAVSGAVRDLLVGHGVDRGRIWVVGGALDDSEPPPAHAVAEQRRAFDVAPVTPVVTACGVLEWRKGHDLFLQLGVALRARGSHAALVWIGDARSDEERVRWDADRQAAGLEGMVRCTGMLEGAAPLAAIAAGDVFVLTSREDPFPRVVLEAGVAGRPVVTFASGGATELVGDGAGVVVDPVDVEAMADAVVDLLADPERAAALGEALRARVGEVGTIAHQGPRLAAVLAGDDPGGR